MMRIREMYEYAYYKVYKSVVFTMEWGADWRAGGLLNMFSSFIYFSVILYVKAIFPEIGHISIWWVLTPIGIITIVDYFILHSRDQWKEVVEKYDAWPPRKNFIGTLIVWGILALITANMLFAGFLMEANRL